MHRRIWATSVIGRVAYPAPTVTSAERRVRTNNSRNPACEDADVRSETYRSSGRTCLRPVEIRPGEQGKRGKSHIPQSDTRCRAPVDRADNCLDDGAGSA